METIKWAVNHMPKTEDANLLNISKFTLYSYMDAGK